MPTKKIPEKKTVRPNSTKTARPETSDAAVEKATGKKWNEWFSILDDAGCASMTHRDIVKILSANHAPGRWWEQTITVGYERARGLREKHQMTDGYQIGVSRTVAATLDELIKRWTDARQRAKWLPIKIEPKKGAAGQSVRFPWEDGATRIHVEFFPKSGGKIQMTVNHRKIKTAAQAAKYKKFWQERMDAFMRESM